MEINSELAKTDIGCRKSFVLFQHKESAKVGSSIKKLQINFNNLPEKREEFCAILTKY